MPVHREKETVPRQQRTTRREKSVTGSTERSFITQNTTNRKAKKSDVSIPEGRGRETLRSKEEKKTEVKQSRSKPDFQRLRTRTRTLSPTEVKQLTKERISKAKSEARVELEKEPEEESDHEAAEYKEAEEEYEDDFEDYESDFESESEKEVQEMDSSPKPVREKTPEPIKSKSVDREVEEVKLAMRKENEMAKSRRNTPEIPESVTHAEILDFSKFQMNKAAERLRRRGRDLLSMITLDAVSYSFLEIPSVPYEVYIKIYGKSDTKQVYVQTNEDDLDEEIQTDFIETCNKWVQKPPEVAHLKYRLTKEERLGVGSDSSVGPEPAMVINTRGLKEFLQRATSVVLPVLQKGTYLGVERFSNQSNEMFFSDGFITLNVSELSSLKRKSVVSVWCDRNEVSNLLSIHTEPKESFGDSAICVWNTIDLSKPLKVLTASNRVTCVCSVPQGLVFAGFSDGTVCLWDLKESSDVHQNKEGITHQSPTYTTAQLSQGHSSAVTSIHVLQETQKIRYRNFTPVQISSLEERGTIIIWSVVLGKTMSTEEDLGLAHWGKIKLVKSSMFSVIPALGKDLPLYVKCNDLAVEQSEDIEMYITNSVGTVTHVSKYGTSMKPKLYGAGDDVETTCLEMCPFNKNYFLVGCKDGSIRSQELPLISLNGNKAEGDSQASIVSLAWLLVRPFVFFALDSLSRIYIWDLGLSDLYPELALTLANKKICCASLIQSDNPKHRPHFVLGTADGQIEIHRMKEEYSVRSKEEIQKDVKKFLKIDVDEVMVLESKVVLAMTRLQKSSFNSSNADGISTSEIAEYLSKKYNLDGDIDSQVLTSLQSGMKKGFICCLRNGKYTLIGPRTGRMIAECISRINHGPECACYLLMMGKRQCCSFKFNRKGRLVRQSDKLNKRKLKKRRKMSFSRRDCRSLNASSPNCRKKSSQQKCSESFV